MSDNNTAFWGMVINNYDETDLALVQQGYPDFIRQIVYTREEGGTKGTPHIQAFVKLHRQQRMSYIRKLFPGASDFRALTSDEYKLNAQRYAQKLDDTAVSPATITNNPFPDPVVELVSVIEEAFRSKETNSLYWHRPTTWAESQPDEPTLLGWISQIEFKRVRLSPRLAKFYVGSMYKNVKKEFLHSLKAHVFDLQNNQDTHTHTHTDEIISVAEDIEDAEDEEHSGEDSQESGTEEDGEDYEDSVSASDEGHSEGSGSVFSTEDD